MRVFQRLTVCPPAASWFSPRPWTFVACWWPSLSMGSELVTARGDCFSFFAGRGLRGPLMTGGRGFAPFRFFLRPERGEGGRPSRRLRPPPPKEVTDLTAQACWTRRERRAEDK